MNVRGLPGRFCPVCRGSGYAKHETVCPACLGAGHFPEHFVFADDRMQALLSDAVAAAGADFGNIQLFDPAKRTLRLAVNEGFDEEFLQFFEVVRGSDTACGAAMEARSRVIVQNVSSSSIYAEDSRRALLRAKVRALQSTPIIGVQDQFLGVLSTHFRNPGRPDRLALQQVDRLIREFLDAGSLVSGSSSDVDIRFKRERG